MRFSSKLVCTVIGIRTVSWIYQHYRARYRLVANMLLWLGDKLWTIICPNNNGDKIQGH